jgi:OmpA-OmpF porin, OOP family
MTNRTAQARRRAALAAAALVSVLALGQSGAFAQEVRVFEYTPPIEQLRSILIPESTGGASRRIIISPQGDLPAASPAQPASASAPTASQATETAAPAQAESSGTTAAPAKAAAPMPSKTVKAEPAPSPTTAAAAPQHADEAKGVVGFRINFALNSAVVPAEAGAFLDELAELLRQERQVSLVVEGHTDAYGGDQYNLQLSALRAQAVTLALVRRGIAPERLAAVGKGKREPLSANAFDPHNRRVQFVRVDGAGT